MCGRARHAHTTPARADARVTRPGSVPDVLEIEPTYVSAADADAAMRAIRAWGEARDWCGWDPYDALTSPFSGVLSAGTRLGRRVLTQAVKDCPLNLRPVLGIPKARNQKAIGLVASAYAHLASLGDDSARVAAESWLTWLEREQVADAGAAWGYHFDVQTRFFSYPAGSPNTIATAFAAQAFLDGAELLGEERHLEVARRAAEFLVREMLVETRAATFFRYVRQDSKLIHNANVLACAVLVRVARLGGDRAFLDPAVRAIQTTLAAQRADGSWPYSEWGGQGWVDNFHTGYVLESLARATEIDGVLGALERGVAFWESAMFLPGGVPKYRPDKIHPLDTHCYAQAIDTWLVLPRTPERLERAARTAALLARDMLRPDGSLIFRRGRLLTNRVAFMRWTAAPSFRALARLAQTRAHWRT